MSLARLLCTQAGARGAQAGLGVGRGVYAVTGADAGLGLATTAALIEAGGVVAMGCASAERGRALAAKINGVTKKESAVVIGDKLDLGSRGSVDAWAAGLEGRLRREGVAGHMRLEGLVHHAGAMGLGQFTATADGEETQWATNFGGPFRLTHALWGRLLADGTRVVCLTSTSHRTPDRAFDPSLACFEEGTYQGWGAYQQSRLAALLFSNRLERRLASQGSDATSRAVCESDKWFYDPRLLLPDDKAELTAGPATTMAALGAGGRGGDYWVDGAVGAPGEHGLSEDAALGLWELAAAREVARDSTS